MGRRDPKALGTPLRVMDIFTLLVGHPLGLTGAS